jgi:hypothetical protein
MRTLNSLKVTKNWASGTFLVAGALILAPSAFAQEGRTGTMIWERGDKREKVTAWQKGTKVRFEWNEPGNKKGDLLVDNGRTVSQFHKGENTVTQTKSRGREWKLSRLKDVKSVNIPDSKFEFVPPKGAKILKIDGTLYGSLPAAKRAADWFKTPENVPVGYSFENAIVGSDKVWQRFSDGKKMFSLFQQKADAGEVAPQKMAGGWFWKKNGIRFLLTGAPDSATSAIAGSLK